MRRCNGTHVAAGTVPIRFLFISASSTARANQLLIARPANLLNRLSCHFRGHSIDVADNSLHI